MGFGLLAGIGGLLGGLGIFKGGSGVGRAAKSLASDTGRAMDAMTKEVREIKEHLIKEAWPRVNDTLTDLQALFKETETFVKTGTFTVKVLAVLLLVCALYILRKQITSAQWHRQASWHRKTGYVVGNSPDLVRSAEQALLQFLSWTCLLLTIVLVLHLGQEVFHIAHVSKLWPANVPFIIIIPSFATMAVILQYIKEISYGITSTILLLVHVIFGLPLLLVCSPLSTRSCYGQTSRLLSAVTLVTIALLYFTVSVPLLFILEVFQLDKPLVWFVLVAYLVFFATAIAISILNEVMLAVLIKPLWSYVAKSHYD